VLNALRLAETNPLNLKRLEPTQGVLMDTFYLLGSLASWHLLSGYGLFITCCICAQVSCGQLYKKYVISSASDKAVIRLKSYLIPYTVSFVINNHRSLVLSMSSKRNIYNTQSTVKAKSIISLFTMQYMNQVMIKGG